MLSHSEIKSFQKSDLLGYFSGKKVLITGASGFIGGYILESISLISTLRAFAPVEVVALSRNQVLNCSERVNESTVIHKVGDKLTDFIIDKQFDIIIHAASPASPKLFSSHAEMDFINSGVMENLVSNQKSLESFVYFSAGEVYGPSAPVFVDETFPTDFDPSQTRSVYPISKIKGEEKLLNLSSKYDFKPFIIRLFHTFGPGIRRNDGRSISDFFWQAACGHTPKLYSDGSSKRSFLFATDMVLAIFYILNSTNNITTYNVGSETLISIKDFALTIAERAGLNKKFIISNSDPNHEKSPIKEIAPNLERLKALGWREQFSLDLGVTITLEWVQSKLQIDSFWGTH